ncbi:MAG: PH domain-containing protein [Candidatus Nanopelagicales bacterium]
MSGAAPDPFATALIRPGRSRPDGRRKVHPLTPFVHGLRVVPVVVVIGISLVTQGRHEGDGAAVLITLAVALASALVLSGFHYLAWRRLTFWFDADGDLRVDSGVLTRQERRLQLSRLQSVEVVAPLLARLVGLAEVRVETAGSAHSKAVLQFLTTAEAQDLRNEIVARAAGVRPDAGEAPEQVLVTVPPGDLVASLLMRGTTVLLLLLTVGVIIPTVIAAGPAALGLVVLGGVPIFTVFSEFSSYFGFTIARSDDGLRLRHGLLRTAHQTVPPGRVQAIGFVQPLLWRRRDWVRVRINVAGMSRDGGSGEKAYTEHTLLPVAPWPVARAVVAHVLPGVDLESIRWESAPTRSRWRAPIQWHRLGVGWDDKVLVTRRGRVTRHWAVMPHARTQSVRVTQGPWQRAVGLASVWFDSTPGPVKVVALHRDAAQAHELALAQARRASTARAGDRITRWAQPPA